MSPLKYFNYDSKCQTLLRHTFTKKISCQLQLQEEFEDTKGVIRIRKSKDRQHNGQIKMDNRTHNNLQNIHIKLKIE